MNGGCGLHGDIAVDVRIDEGGVVACDGVLQPHQMKGLEGLRQPQQVLYATPAYSYD